MKSEKNENKNLWEYTCITLILWRIIFIRKKNRKNIRRSLKKSSIMLPVFWQTILIEKFGNPFNLRTARSVLRKRSSRSKNFSPSKFQDARMRASPARLCQDQKRLIIRLESSSSSGCCVGYWRRPLTFLDHRSHERA